ncbi:hypothetical protein [Neptunomonas qingdaonensis]|uniref:Uncharacterized protein n=1 Tax=Neptunomonas qingdaonensis TaxID=1045558 RepID=A0A1I2PPU4_9GAMM|nr:hypothetical protein [Neptunomonas qingdaonensis]SFG18068.1 hypothetical protein SAMN05216175_1047 [Neptunomonas qingdaonensis]
MFEAHQPTADLSPNSDCHQKAALPLDQQIIDQIIYNKTHHCFVRAWSSHGKQISRHGNVSATLFLYIEYKNHHDTSCYLCKELTEQSLLDNQFLVMLAESVLLKDISAPKTDAWIALMQN